MLPNRSLSGYCEQHLPILTWLASNLLLCDTSFMSMPTPSYFPHSYHFVLRTTEESLVYPRDSTLVQQMKPIALTPLKMRELELEEWFVKDNRAAYRFGHASNSPLPSSIPAISPILSQHIKLVKLLLVASVMPKVINNKGSDSVYWSKGPNNT